MKLMHLNLFDNNVVPSRLVLHCDCGFYLFIEYSNVKNSDKWTWYSFVFDSAIQMEFRRYKTASN